MRKDLHRLAHRLQALLRHHAEQGSLHQAPRAAIDGWAALTAWHAAGEPMLRLTDESEDALLTRGLPPDLALATAPTTRRGDALLIQTPDRAHHVIVARLAQDATVPIADGAALTMSGRLLVYCIPQEFFAAGYYQLRDQPTPSALQLLPGLVARADGTAIELSDSALALDDYLVTLGILALYSRP
jgi:hypothetical protein